MADDLSHAKGSRPTLAESVVLPWTGVTLIIHRPRDTDLLLDLVERDPEQNLPYWAEIWPSGIALADAILRDPAAVAGLDVLEVGSGIGTTAAAAMRSGARLLAADYFADALAACRANCLGNDAPAPETLVFNWRAPDGAIPNGRQWPVILAADVLYEKRDIEPLLAFLERFLAPGGLFWLAEPGRPPATVWLDAVRTLGWNVESENHPGPWPDPKDEGVVVGLHKVKRG